MKRAILIVGHGYLGGHLSELLESDTFDIFVTTRNRSKIARLKSGKIEPIEFDVLDQGAEVLDRFFDTVVYCVGFDPSQGVTRHDVYVGGLKNFLSKLKRAPDKFIYVSSTGVYGNSDSTWIDEETVPQPSRESGLACLEAEQQLDDLTDSVAVTILRLAGIYGAERIPNRAKLESGEVLINGDGYLNLIHANDAARIIKWFVDKPQPTAGKEIFNVSDGHPVRRIEFYRTLAELVGVDAPLIATSTDPEHGRKTGSKKISNQKLVNETEYQFAFQTYKQGLESILRE